MADTTIAPVLGTPTESAHIVFTAGATGTFKKAPLSAVKVLFGIDDKVDKVAGASLVPAGGANGQLLAKSSDEDGAVGWVNPEQSSSSLPVGGTTGQVLAKTSNANGAANWITLPASLELATPVTFSTSIPFNKLNSKMSVNAAAISGALTPNTT